MMDGRRTLAAAGLALAMVAGGCGNVKTPSSLRQLPVGSSSAAQAAASGPAGPGRGADEADSGGRSAPDTAELLAPAFQVEYQVRGTLPSLASTAPAYELATPVGKEAVVRLARALGLSAKVEATDGTGWSVAAGQGRLTVEPFGGSPWYFGSETAVTSSGCAVASPEPVAMAEEGKLRAEIAVPPDSYMACELPTPPPDLPSAAEAERLARAFFNRAGIGVEGAQARVDEYTGVGWGISFQTVVGGLPVLGLEQSVTIGSKGAVVSASGQLASPRKLGDYPLVGAAEGFQRLVQEGEAGFGGGPRPLGAAEPAVDLPDCASPTVMCDPPVPAPAPSAPVVREVTDADIVLMAVPTGCTNQTLLLVPAYRFAVADGGFAGPVAAAGERHLARPEAGQRGSDDEPCPGPGKAGDTDPSEPVEPPRPATDDQDAPTDAPTDAPITADTDGSSGAGTVGTSGGPGS